MTFVQFLRAKITLLTDRKAAAEVELESFRAMGGKAVYDAENGTYTVSHGETVYTVRYGKDGTVAEYNVRNPLNKESMSLLHRVFFATYMLPKYEAIIESTQETLRNLDNDSTLRGMGEMRRIIRDDNYLTVAAVSGVGVDVEKDDNPFAVLGEVKDE